MLLLAAPVVYYFFVNMRLSLFIPNGLISLCEDTAVIADLLPLLPRLLDAGDRRALV